MNIKKEWLFLTIFLIIPFISATTYSQSSIVDLKIPFEVNGTPASSTAVCNVSIQYPNSTYLRDNNATTNLNNGLFNITLNENETKFLGIYTWVAFCCDNGNCGAGYDMYEITPSGADALNTGEGINLAIAVISILLIGLLFFIATLKSERLASKIIFGGITGLMILITVLFTSVIFAQTMGVYSELVAGYATFWMVIKTGISIAILGLLLFGGFIGFKLWQYKRGFID